jgi:anhydro-N-acetylmuramic acid kinase
MFFDSEAKEAVAFALIGYLHLTNRPGNLPSATGARGPRILGVLTPASNEHDGARYFAHERRVTGAA